MSYEYERHDIVEDIDYHTITQVDKYPLGLSIETLVNRKGLNGHADLPSSETVAVLPHDEAEKLRDSLIADYPMNNLIEKPKRVYELRYVNCDGYYTLATTLDKSLLEKVIDEVKAHDAEFVKSDESRQFYCDHPLYKFDCEWLDNDFDYDNARDQTDDTWASALEIAEVELWEGDNE